ncbi:MAG: NAD(+) diphosphatase, partial [Bacteroidales bacterium]|nr:NAD(+) diphosphatase [Bacteroidales bacterium]
MIHEIFPHKFDNQYSSKKAFEDDDYVLHYSEHKILLKQDGEDLYLPQKKDFNNINGNANYIFLFTLNEQSCFLARDELQTDGSNIAFKELTFFRTTKQRELAWIAMAGIHLHNWYLQNKYCGVCGSKMRHKTGERALICNGCNT